MRKTLNKRKSRRKIFIKARNVKNNNLPENQRRGITLTQKFANKVHEKSLAHLKAKRKAIKQGRKIVTNKK